MGFFSKEEIKRNLLGCFEVALFMPEARKRFGDSDDEAMRSFIVPVIFFPLTLLAVYMYPKPEIANDSTNTIALLYSLRLIATWLLFLGTVYFIVKNIGRKEHFHQFVTATNWLTIPATVIFFPIVVMLFSGTHGWEELYPFMMALMYYSYAFTAFMTAYVLRLPWELAGFITMIGLIVNNSTLDVLYWVGAIF